MSKQPNILFITADDMNWDAVGAYGCPVKGTTPNIDRLASEGMTFNYAHVNIAVCQPSRSALMTGLYPHHSGGEGFFNLRKKNVPILPELLRTGGYQVGILGKVGHSTPYCSFQWDMCYDMDDLGQGRNPQIYRQHTETFLAEAKQSGKPFFLMLNSHDPHRPFYGNDKPEWYDENDTVPPAVAPSGTFRPEEVVTPGFLYDLPDVRLEISEYYSSVRRCDDTIGEALDALEQAGFTDDTIVIFLSDNGMAFPFSKTNCYLHSTKTPWIMRWPKTIDAGSCDRSHFISGIDLMPTLLDAAGIAPPEYLDGHSFLPILKSEQQNGRDYVFTQFHQTAGRRNYPMRCVQSRKFGYIYNPWSNGEREFMNESQAGRTMKAMREASLNEQELADRVQMFLYRVPEELYNFEEDPDALHNLAGDPEYADELNKLRSVLEVWMVNTNDSALEAFRNLTSGAHQEKYVAQVAKELGGQ